MRKIVIALLFLPTLVQVGPTELLAVMLNQPSVAEKAGGADSWSENMVTALIAAGGVVAGALIAMAGQLMQHWIQERSKVRHDAPRRRLLLTMLEDDRFQWRKLETLSHVIGADAATTKQLLLDIGARASEDGQELWGLISRNPLGSRRPAQSSPSDAR